MKITSLDVRACSISTSRSRPIKLRDSTVQLPFLVLSIHTDEGITGTSLGFAGRTPLAAAHLAAAARSFLIGRDPFERIALWNEYRHHDRWWNLSPIWIYGPIDVALWERILAGGSRA